MTDPPLPTASPPDIGDLAAACVRFVHGATGFTLDFTPETLPVLDHYLRAQVRGSEPAIIELAASTAGAYFGEVIRAALEGVRWAEGEADLREQRLEFEPFFLCFNPIGAALEAILGAKSEGWRAHFQVLDDAQRAVASALERAGEVATEDYYTLCVRFEALEQVADVVSALESRHEPRRSFGPDVYRAANGAPRDEPQGNAS